jgi:predicted XRE-type DNA-binding protein
VWDAIGDTAEEAANLRVRADLMIEMEQLMRRRRLTQARAAKLFGVTEPRVDDLVRGRISSFSVEALIAMLSHAGMTVTVSVKPAA